MKSKMKHYVKEFIYFVVVMTIFANVISLYKSQSLNKTPLTLKSFQLLNNQVYKVSNEKPLLIHFWATWCPTCKLEASNIDYLSNYFNVITIAVNSGSDDEINNFLHEHNYTYKVVNDNNGFLASKFKLAAYPTTFIYDKNSNLIFSDVGYSSTFSMYLKMLWASYK